jgi:hypothetical protein
MKEKEFRIGNLVYGKKIETVRGIIDGYVWFNDEANLHIELCQPIPLTEEWLLKFDFEITNNFQTKDRFQTHIQDGIIWFEYGYIVIELKYVHQLQNLYFALIGEELTFKQQEQ